MIKTLFPKYVDRFLPKLQKLIEMVNEKRGDQQTYLHKSMLNQEYAPDNKWESSTVNTLYVRADYVAEDSPLPLKARPTLRSSAGKLPKLGVKRTLRESEITQLRIMELQGGNHAQISKKLANDAVMCARAIDETNEWAFLYGLSHGYIPIKDEDAADNQLLRINFNYLDDRQFTIASASDGLTVDDLKRVIKKAKSNGNRITKVLIADTTYDALRETQGARELVATYSGQSLTYVTTDGTTVTVTLPVPTPERFDAAFKSETKAEFVVIDRVVYREANGVPEATNPFAEDKVVFICSDKVGSLVYGTVAAEQYPVPQVSYQKVDGYKLISKYAEEDPLIEYTAGQAFVAPIIGDVDQIYLLDIAGATAVDEDAESSDTDDTTTTIDGTAYSKAAIVSAFTELGVTTITESSTDEEIIAAYNALSAAKKSKFQTLAASYSA